MQEEHPFPIYMQEKYDDCPSSEKFPKREIVERFCQNYRRGRALEGSEVNEYFTSSFAYMCALALHLDFKVIEVYGFEMATDTEYRYQKGSTEFWLGIAGQHADVLVQKECRLMEGALYGYEVSRMINRQRLEFLKGRYRMELDSALKQMNYITGRRSENDGLHKQTKIDAQKDAYAIRGRELLQQEIRAGSIVNEKQGRVNMITDLMKTVDNMQAGKDPGDGFFGPEGDLDPQLEQQRQDEAKAAAETAKEPPEGSVAEASEGR